VKAKLKLCPLCKGKPNDCGYDADTDSYEIYCLTCGCHIERETHELVVEAWNTRVKEGVKEKLKKIEWKEGQYGFEYGFVGKIRLFSCGYEEKGKYLLTTTLPQHKTFLCENMDECKEKAIEVLRKFIEYIRAKESK